MTKIKLGNLIRVISGTSFQSKFFNDVGEGIPLIRIRDVSLGESFTYYSGDYEEKYLINEGDFLVTMDGSFILRKWKSRKSLLNQRVCKIEVVETEKIDPQYLYWILPYYLKEIENKTPYVTVKHLSVKKIEEIEIELPLLKSQAYVSKILDISSELIKKRKIQLEEMDNLIQSIFYNWFIREIDSVKTIKLGEISNHISSGSTPKGGSSVYLPQGEIKFIRSQNVRMNYLDYEDIVFICEDLHHSMKRSQLKKNDILLNITGASIGRVALYQGEDGCANTNQHVASIRLESDGFIPIYIQYFLSSDWMQHIIMNESAGGTREALNYQQIKNFDIPVFPINKQHEFSKIVEEIETQKSLMEKSLIEMENYFNALMQKAFKGELFPEE